MARLKPAPTHAFSLESLIAFYWIPHDWTDRSRQPELTPVLCIACGDTEWVRFLIGVLLWWSASLLEGQSDSEWRSCPVIGDMPADAKWTEALSQRQRFELRQCYGDKIIVIGYERAKATPSLVFDTGDGYPRFLAHAENILVFQSLGGASDHVYVFSFKSGKPSVALRKATKGIIQVRQSKTDLVVMVPPITYPQSDGKFPRSPASKQYSFPIEQ